MVKTSCSLTLKVRVLVIVVGLALAAPLIWAVFPLAEMIVRGILTFPSALVMRTVVPGGKEEVVGVRRLDIA